MLSASFEVQESLKCVRIHHFKLSSTAYFWPYTSGRVKYKKEDLWSKNSSTECAVNYNNPIASVYMYVNRHQTLQIKYTALQKRLWNFWSIQYGFVFARKGSRIHVNLHFCNSVLSHQTIFAGSAAYRHCYQWGLFPPSSGLSRKWLPDVQYCRETFQFVPLKIRKYWWTGPQNKVTVRLGHGVLWAKVYP